MHLEAVRDVVGICEGQHYMYDIAFGLHLHFELGLTLAQILDLTQAGEGSFLLSQSPFLLSRYSVRILSVFCPYSVFLTEYGILSTRREYTEYVKNTRYSVHQNTWSVFCPYSAYSVIR